jgi:hypothetical protein
LEQADAIKTGSFPDSGTFGGTGLWPLLRNRETGEPVIPESVQAAIKLVMSLLRLINLFTENQKLKTENSISSISQSAR